MCHFVPEITNKIVSDDNEGLMFYCIHRSVIWHYCGDGTVHSREFSTVYVEGMVAA